MKAVRVFGDDPQYLDVTLQQILDCCSFRDHLFWNVQFVEAYGYSEFPASASLGERLHSSFEGHEVSLDELGVISAYFNPMLNMCVIGDKDKQRIRHYTDAGERRANCFYVIEYCDSTYWDITCLREEELQRFKEQLPKTAYVNL